MDNLMDGLIDELNRNRELKKIYDTIPTGGFGSHMIQADIDAGEDAIKSGDVVKMMAAYQTLKENE